MLISGLISRSTSRSVVRRTRQLSACLALTGVAAAIFSGCGGGGSHNIGPVPTTGATVGSGVNGSSASGQTPTGTAPGVSPFTNGTLASRNACTLNAHQAGRAAWTVLVYMNAASNLQPDSLINIAQMVSVGSNANLNIVVQWKQTTSAAQYFTSVTPQTTPSFIGTRRYYLKKHSQADINAIAPAGIDTSANIVGNTTVLDADRLADPPTNTLSDQGNPTADMGKYQTLKDFVQWGAKTYPADHLCVVIWDHGSGALNVVNRSARYGSALKSRGVLSSATKSRSALSKVRRGLSQDTQTGNEIATQELPLGLANPPQPIDHVVIDCSLEGTTEVAYDLRASARVFSGTEESPPGAGYPYDKWLAYLQTNTAGPCDSGTTLLNATVAAYPNETNITESMIDLSQMNTVAAAVNAFGGSLNAHTSDQATLIQTARQTAQYFDFPEYKDLYHFADLIRVSSNVPTDLAQAAATVQNSLWGANGAIMLSSHGQASTQEAHASGLSIFLPGPLTVSSVDDTTGYDPQYGSLGFAKAAPNWSVFLQHQQK